MTAGRCVITLLFPSLHCKFDHLVGAIVNAHLLVSHDVTAHVGKEVIIVYEKLHHLKGVCCVLTLKGSVTYLRGMDSAPALVSADSLNEELRHRIEGKLTWLCDKDIAASQ